MHSGVVGLWTCIYGYLCMLFPCPIIIRQLLFGQKATGSWTNAPVLLNWKGGVFHCPRRVKPMGMGQNMGLTQDKQLKSALWRVNIGPQTDAIKLHRCAKQHAWNESCAGSKWFGWKLPTISAAEWWWDMLHKSFVGRVIFFNVQTLFVMVNPKLPIFFD